MVADPLAELIRAYGAKVPLLDYARHMTFVIGRDRTITRIDRGPDAIDALDALDSCSTTAPGR